MTASNEELLALADWAKVGSERALSPTQAGQFAAVENVMRRLAAQSGGEVRVKPLEWDNHGRADVYTVRQDTMRVDQNYFMARGDKIIEWFDDEPQAKAAAQADYERRIRSALISPTSAPASVAAVKEACKQGIYIASKIRHAERWRFLRDKVGEPIISTWIDEAGPGESADLHDLWSRCLQEAASCQVLIAYREPDDVLKGAWVEIGAALTAGIPVYAVGLDEFTIAKYRGITHFPDMKSAVAASRNLIAAAIDKIDVAASAPSDAVREAWIEISDDTSWLDGRDVVIRAHGMEVSARYCPGEWSNETPDHPREYDGAVWSCFDDEFQIEIEECSKDPREWCHNGVTHWRAPTALTASEGNAAAGPSDAVTVEELADFIDELDILHVVATSDDDEAASVSRALLERYDVRRR